MPINFNSYFNEYLLQDCLIGLADLPDNYIDLVCCDPPFNIMVNHNLTFKDRTDIVQSAEFDQFESYAKYLQFMIHFFIIIIRKMKSPSSMLMFTATENISDLIRAAECVGLVRKNILAWWKNNPMYRVYKTNFVSAYESILYFVKDYPPFHYTTVTDMHNVIKCPIPSQTERIKKWDADAKDYVTVHPTQKPMKLIEKLIRITTDPMMVVCDPFAGVATTNVACQNLGRKCISYEINPEYHRYGIQRLQTVQGRLKPSVQKTLTF